MRFAKSFGVCCDLLCNCNSQPRAHLGDFLGAVRAAAVALHLLLAGAELDLQLLRAQVALAAVGQLAVARLRDL